MSFHFKEFYHDCHANNKFIVNNEYTFLLPRKRKLKNKKFISKQGEENAIHKGQSHNAIHKGQSPLRKT